MFEFDEVVVLLFFCIFYLVAFGIGIAAYIMSSLAFYGIAVKQGLKNAWRAWVPYLNIWLLGDVVDYFEVKNGFKKRWAKVLIGFLIAMVASILLFIVAVFVAMILVTMYEGMFYYSAFSEVIMLIAILLVYIVYFVLILVTVASASIQTIGYYKIFENIYPDKSMKYLIISMLVPLGAGFVLLKCKKLYNISDESCADEFCLNDSEEN